MSHDLTCAECRERLPLYVANTLAADEAEAVRRHLVGCAACGKVATQWRVVVAALTEADRRIPSDGNATSGWLALRAQLPSQQPPASSHSWKEAHRMEDKTASAPVPETANAAPSVTARGRRKDPRPLFALVAAMLLIALSATLFGVFGARIRQGESSRNQVASTATLPSVPACAPNAVTELLPAYASIFGIKMISAHDGWAVGEIYDAKHEATPPHPLLLRFQNCRWVDASAMSDVSKAPAQLFSIAMDSATDGWAVGTYMRNDPYSQPNGSVTYSWDSYQLLLLHYTNGQWRQAQVPAGAASGSFDPQIVMTSPNEGWLAIDHTLPNGSSAGQLFHYLHGSWSSVPLTFDAPVAPHISAIAASEPGECWVVGSSNNSRSGFVVARYLNGAWQTWSSRQIGASGVLSLENISQVGPDDVWVSGTYSSTNGDTSKRNTCQGPTGSAPPTSISVPFLSHFTDGSWSGQQTPPLNNPKMACNIDLDLIQMTMFSSSTGWVFSDSGMAGNNPIEALHEVGGKWEWVSLPPPMNRVLGFSLFSPTQGFAIVDTSFLGNENTSGVVVAQGQLIYYDVNSWTNIANN